MGVAYVEITADVIDALRSPPRCDKLSLLSVADMGDGFFLVEIASPLIEGCNQMLELVLESDGVRFKRAEET